MVERFFILNNLIISVDALVLPILHYCGFQTELPDLLFFHCYRRHNEDCRTTTKTSRHVVILEHWVDKQEQFATLARKLGRVPRPKDLGVHKQDKAIPTKSKHSKQADSRIRMLVMDENVPPYIFAMMVTH